MEIVQLVGLYYNIDVLKSTVFIYKKSTGHYHAAGALFVVFLYDATKLHLR